jgi:hypothetical protein
LIVKFSAYSQQSPLGSGKAAVVLRYLNFELGNKNHRFEAVIFCSLTIGLIGKEVHHDCL